MDQFVIANEPYISIVSMIGLVAFGVLIPIFMYSQTDRRFRLTSLGLVVCLIISQLDFGWSLAAGYFKNKEVETCIQTVIDEQQTLVLCGSIVPEPHNFYKELHYFRTTSSAPPQQAGRYTLVIINQTETTLFILRRGSEDKDRVWLYYPKYDPGEFDVIGSFSLDLPGLKELFDACESAGD